MLQSGVDHRRAGAGTLSVVVADNQKGKPGYEGCLSERVHSLDQLMRDGGYATYLSTLQSESSAAVAAVAISAAAGVAFSLRARQRSPGDTIASIAWTGEATPGEERGR